MQSQNKVGNVGILVLRGVCEKLYYRGRKLGQAHETLMIAKHETSIDFYGASEKWI